MGRVDLRDEIIEALVRHGSATVELLIAQLRCGRPGSKTIRRGRARTHRRLNAQQPRLLTHSNDESLAIDAANALGQIGDADAVDGLLNLIGDEDASVRQAAVSALNSLTLPSMAKRIIPLLHDPDPNVRESAVKIAGYFGYPEAAEALLDLSHDPDERVRCAAIEHLPFVEDERALGCSRPCSERRNTECPGSCGPGAGQHGCARGRGAVD